MSKKDYILNCNECEYEFYENCHWSEIDEISCPSCGKRNLYYRERYLSRQDRCYRERQEHKDFRRRTDSSVNQFNNLFN